jgi:hypothetical protein
MTSYNEKEKNVELAQFIEYLDKQFWIASAAGDKKAAQEIMDFKQSLSDFKKKLDSIFSVEENETDPEVLDFIKRNFGQS